MSVLFDVIADLPEGIAVTPVFAADKQEAMKAGKELFPGHRVTVVLKDILMRLSDHRINVSDARVRTSPAKPARIDLRVELQSSTQLTSTLNQIRAMADVLDIARMGMGS